jgi:hypothetical protein
VKNSAQEGCSKVSVWFAANAQQTGSIMVAAMSQQTGFGPRRVLHATYAHFMKKNFRGKWRVKRNYVLCLLPKIYIGSYYSKSCFFFGIE